MCLAGQDNAITCLPPRAYFGVQLMLAADLPELAPDLALPPPESEVLRDRFTSPNPPACPGVLPRLRSSSLFPAEDRSDRLGVMAGGAIDPEPAADAPLAGVLPVRLRSAAARKVSDSPPVPEAPERGRGVKPLARSCIDRLALSPSLRAISSRRFVLGRLKDGRESSGSSLAPDPPSRARGVDMSVPHVSKLGSDSGAGDGSAGRSG